MLTLNCRAQEARHPKAIINDPMAIGLVDALDVDFAKFGATRQDQALRALAFDRVAIDYLTQHPNATVVAPAHPSSTPSRMCVCRRASIRAGAAVTVGALAAFGTLG